MADGRMGGGHDQVRLVAVDGSEPGGRALDLAGDIAAKCDAALTLLHVQAHPAHGGVPKDLEDYARIEHVELTEARWSAR